MGTKNMHVQRSYQGSNRNIGGGELGQNEEKDEMLDLVNKVQMFRIAIKKINHNLEVKGKIPVFDLADNADKLKFDGH